MNRCRSCGASIVWAKTTKGRMMPLDAEPAERGTVLIHEGKAWVYGSLEALTMRDHGVALHVPHHATCPDAHKWKGKDYEARKREARQ